MWVLISRFLVTTAPGCHLRLPFTTPTHAINPTDEKQRLLTRIALAQHNTAVLAQATEKLKRATPAHLRVKFHHQKNKGVSGRRGQRCSYSKAALHSPPTA